jgi:hypothetical protein
LDFLSLACGRAVSEERNTHAETRRAQRSRAATKETRIRSYHYEAHEEHEEHEGKKKKSNQEKTKNVLGNNQFLEIAALEQNWNNFAPEAEVPGMGRASSACFRY